MADEPLQNGDVPPAGEAIHLPDPSYLPVIVAAGTTLVLVGVVINLWIFGLGLAVTVVAIARWIGQTREEMAELPLDHGH
ncbi:MAG: aa3-type cytochrome oxidase subunit IV [Thermoleophilaceae bacterium]